MERERRDPVVMAPQDAQRRETSRVGGRDVSGASENCDPPVSTPHCEEGAGAWDLPTQGPSRVIPGSAGSFLEPFVN